MAKKISPKTPNQKRPAVVVVLGHVDHGKTTLLDYIRKTKVQEKEAGGITQHIGAYQIQTDKKDPDTNITFIDTPGHEAFKKMRSRGAKVADLAILVVAANDGVKPQTKEAIAHIKNAKLPFLVAVNKIDLPDTHIEVIKGQLAENEVYAEGYGGDIVVAPISAKQGKGIDHLLEMLHLLWQMQEIKTKNNYFKAVILESFVDQGKGVVANLLIRSGQLKLADFVSCGEKNCKIKSMINQYGQPISIAQTSQPVQILGFKKVLPIGQIITKTVKSISKLKTDIILPKSKISTKTDSSEEKDQQSENKKLKIILKADVAGTLEAIKANLTQEIELIDQGVGDIAESDVLLARSTKARIIGFNVKTPGSVKKLAEMEEVKITTYNIIYHLLEDLQKKVLKLLEPTIDEEIIGKAKIIAEFNIKKTHIAGCKVLDGKIVRSEKVKILRDDKVVAQPRIGALQVERKEEKEAKKDQEVALVFRPDVKFQIGDQVISYKILDE